MIDMDPSDLSCVYSTLCYISSHAKKYNVTPVVTFDQPLWWKALQIRESVPEDDDLHSIMLCLGGFHTIMVQFIPTYTLQRLRKAFATQEVWMHKNHCISKITN